eukprot:TRINITY_DN92945_c0_g1_i1.p1 TRINITY_DN92945_c0_g1~~TRINITY_DN92945_c0_g1_i1.p1  ORF type:complete len:338 (-),score=66.74 TRINITY_DN92945_c0_g1_i1:241-1254(-)
MPTVRALCMDGSDFEVEVALQATVLELRKLFADVTGWQYPEVTLLMDCAMLEDQLTLDVVFADHEDFEVVLMRCLTTGTVLLTWYERWREVKRRVELLSEQGVDARPEEISLGHLRLGACLYSLGEYQTSWHAYRQAATAASNFKHEPNDAQLLEDATVGKYVRYLDRAYKRNQWKYDFTRTRELIKLLVEHERGSEIVSESWAVGLPNASFSFNEWIRGLRREDDLAAVDFLSLRGGTTLKVTDTPNKLLAQVWCPHQQQEKRMWITMSLSKADGADEAEVVAVIQRVPGEQRPEAVAVARMPGRSGKRRAHKANAHPELGTHDEDWDDDWEDWQD